MTEGVKIEVPDFREMSDEDLHGWEFTVYERTPEMTGDLDEVIGAEKAPTYYRERGRRVDLRLRDHYTEEVAKFQKLLDGIQERLKSGTSGEYHFQGARV